MTNCLAMLVSVLHLVLEVFHTMLSRESMRQATSIWNWFLTIRQIFLIHCDIPVLNCFPLHLYRRKVFIITEFKGVSVFHLDLSL